MKHWHIWVALTIILSVVEILTPGFVILCFAAGALLAAVVAGLGLSIAWQVLGFAVGSFIAFVTVRPAMRRWASKKGEGEKTNVDRLVGQGAIVVETTDDERGQVKIGGETWAARSSDGEELAVGSKVVVARIDGNKAVVASQG